MSVGQAFLGSLLIPLAMILSRKLFDHRTAVVTGIITAFYPTLIAFSPDSFLFKKISRGSYPAMPLRTVPLLFYRASHRDAQSRATSGMETRRYRVSEPSRFS